MATAEVEIVRQFGHANQIPHTLHVLFTTKCSLGCPGCFYRDQPGEWPVDSAYNLVEEAARLGVRWIAIGGGEPTEWEYLIPLLHEICKHNLRVAVTTNGTVLLDMLPERVHISHDCMHAGRLSWETREEEVTKAINYYRERGLEVGLNSIVDDAYKISETLLHRIDNITLILRKPIVLAAGWEERIRETIARCSKYTRVLGDSCLTAVLGSGCGQGRISMSINQRGCPSVCSNIESKLWPVHPCPPGKLLSAWKLVKCTESGLPDGCLVKEALHGSSSVG